MLSILCVISNPEGWGGKRAMGGGEMRTIEILKRWHSWGVHVETLETNPPPSLLMRANYNVHVISLPLRGNSVIAIFANTFALFLKCLWKVLFINREIDVVITSTSNFSDVGPAWLISRLLKKPFVVVFQVTAYASSLPATYKLLRELTRERLINILRALSASIMFRLVKSSSALICNSDPVAETLKKLGFPAGYLYVTGMGVDLDLIETIRCEDKKYDGVFLGRIEWYKGVQDLIDAWKIVTKSKPHSKLLVVGSGGSLKDAKQHVQELELDDNVDFVGFVATNKKFSYLKMSKLFIFPSKTEGWPLAVNEAMACGLPVVCYDIPPVRRIFGGCKGVFLTPVDDVQGLAKTTLWLLDNEESLSEYSRTSKIYAQQFGWGSVAKRELEIVRACA